MILGDVQSPQSRTRAALATMLASLGAALAADSEVQGRIDGLIERLANQAIARRSEIGGFVADVIKQWDARTLSDRFELVIGSDLLLGIGGLALAGQFDRENRSDTTAKHEQKAKTR